MVHRSISDKRVVLRKRSPPAVIPNLQTLFSAPSKLSPFGLTVYSAAPYCKRQWKLSSRLIFHEIRSKHRAESVFTTAELFSPNRIIISQRINPHFQPMRKLVLHTGCRAKFQVTVQKSTVAHERGNSASSCEGIVSSAVQVYLTLCY